MFCSNVISKMDMLYSIRITQCPPIPSNRPTAGKMAIENMNDFPNCCAFQIIYSFYYLEIKSLYIRTDNAS